MFGATIVSPTNMYEIERLDRPYRAWNLIDIENPGRCPGLD